MKELVWLAGKLIQWVAAIVTVSIIIALGAVIGVLVVWLVGGIL